MILSPEQEAVLKEKAEEISNGLQSFTWRDLEAKGKFSKNEKLTFIRNGMLIVGCDTGSEMHYVRAIDTKGRKLSKGAFSFENNAEGFQSAKDWVLQLAAQNEKNQIVLGQEPTGHYWFSLAAWMIANGISCWSMQMIADELIRLELADVFMIFEPLAGKRDTIITESRTAVDFANVLKHTSDVLYPNAEKIVLVTDNLNTHSPASLYKAFPPEEACRLAERFEWHFTPKHGSWLDMAEMELSILARQALFKPLPDLASFTRQIRAWTAERNALCQKTFWHFTTADARIKLAKLYPNIL